VFVISLLAPVGTWAQSSAYVNYGSFTVGGTSSSYYPVRFTSSVYGAAVGATTNDLVLFRDNTHENGSWFGTFYFIVDFHPADYGHFPLLNVIERLAYQTGTGSPYNDPLGDVADGSAASGGNDLIVWLKGGATYHWRNRDTTAGWTLTNGNSAGGSITDSSGATRNPISSQSSLILSSKNAFYVNAIGLGTANNLIVGGSVGVGVTSPGAKLEVYGNVKLSSGSGGSITFADGTTQSTAWTGSLCGGDYAESVEVSGDRAQYEPGDVLVIASEITSDVAKSVEPYSTLVAGIYSTKPGLVGNRSTEQKRVAKQVPMAMIGIVPVKVTAENGAIRRGDLLVTSSLPGYAMKGTDHNRMLGAVIGKALGSLESGTGVIEALVSLQ